MNITITSVSHDTQRYDTCGDWMVDGRGDHLHIRVSRLGDKKMEAAVAIHELVEALLCRWAGIKEEDVTAFDMAYQGEGEPGDDPAAPYRKQHEDASLIEQMFCRIAGIDLDEYEAAIARLEYKP